MPKLTGKTESYRADLLKSLTRAEDAAHYLNACLEDEDTHLNCESLYRMLSKSGNPSLDSLAAVLNAFGLRLAVQSAAPKRGTRRIA
jgi:DNA-binding phage protein